MSRHRKIQCSRSKAVALIAAGAFTVATAATAAVANWPAGSSGSSGPAAGRVHEAGAGSLLTVTGQRLQMQAFEQSTASQALQAYQLRDQAAELSAAHWNTARAQAARKLAARKLAAAKLAAAKAATAQATANTAIAQNTATAQPTPSATASAAPVASGSPQQVARAMLASFGWSSGQFSCLDPLWAHESGWSVTAYNAGSGAYGIPQALPGSRMASAGPDWQTNAATQIRWGLEYIEGTYGSPCAAWDHEQATGWY
ncbi:MAG: lytic transglycosylase domain-containing protein [Streptosporangiaceae bacterium]